MEELLGLVLLLAEEDGPLVNEVFQVGRVALHHVHGVVHEVRLPVVQRKKIAIVIAEKNDLLSS